MSISVLLASAHARQNSSGVLSLLTATINTPQSFSFSSAFKVGLRALGASRRSRWRLLSGRESQLTLLEAQGVSLDGRDS